MGSKKDRLRDAAKKQMDKATGGAPGMPGLVRDMAADRAGDASEAPSESGAGAPQGAGSAHESSRAASRKVIPEPVGEQNSGKRLGAESEWSRTRPQDRESIRMARTRDSVYNVSSDIRLEDYTESQGGGGGRVGRIVAAVLLFILLAWGLSKVWGWIFSPGYQLAIAGQEITDDNMRTYLKGDTVSASPGRPMVHIRFQWDEGELKTDIVRIRADLEQAGAFSEIATLSRKAPVTVNYVYFANILEPGKYRVQVSDKEGKVLRERTIRVQ